MLGNFWLLPWSKKELERGRSTQAARFSPKTFITLHNLARSAACAFRCHSIRSTSNTVPSIRTKFDTILIPTKAPYSSWASAEFIHPNDSKSSRPVSISAIWKNLTGSYLQHVARLPALSRKQGPRNFLHKLLPRYEVIEVTSNVNPARFSEYRINTALKLASWWCASAGMWRTDCKRTYLPERIRFWKRALSGMPLAKSR